MISESPKKQQLAGQLAVLGAAFLWSTSGLFIKFLDWHPMVIAGARSSVSAAFLLTSLGAEKSLTVKRNSAAIELLAPEMTIGCQSRNLMNRPLVLQRNAAARTAICPASCSFFGVPELILSW